MDCLNFLLPRDHWLFLGYSGADLAAAPSYLGLRANANTAAGFTWLVRTGCEPLDAVIDLANVYGDKAEIVYGELPAYILDLEARSLGVCSEI